jgi:hypothetical protein
VGQEGTTPEGLAAKAAHSSQLAAGSEH